MALCWVRVHSTGNKIPNQDHDIGRKAHDLQSQPVDGVTVELRLDTHGHVVNNVDVISIACALLNVQVSSPKSFICINDHHPVERDRDEEEHFFSNTQVDAQLFCEVDCPDKLKNEDD